MTALVAFTLAAAATFVLRSSMTFAGAGSASSRVGACVALVAPAVLAAMVASSLFLDHGDLARPRLGEAVAIGAALAVVRKTGNVSAALAVGLPVYWLAAALGGG